MRVRLNGRMLIFCAVIAVLAAIIVINILPRSTQVTYEYFVNGVTGTGLIARSETVTDVSSFEKLCYDDFKEGQAVSAGAEIAQGYKRGYVKTALSGIRETEKAILAYQTDTLVKDIALPELTQFDFDISVILEQMSRCESGYSRLHIELTDLFTKRLNFIRENFSPDSAMQKLYDDEKSKVDAMAAWTETIKAEKSGFISLNCDGCDIQNFTSVKQNDIKAAMRQVYRTQAKKFKIVEDTSWFIAVEADKSISAYSVGTQYPLYIGASTETENATLVSTAGDKQLIFRIDDNVEKYLDCRVINICVGEKRGSFAVDSNFVVNSELITRENGKREVVPITVLRQNGGKTYFDADNIRVFEKVYNK